MFIASGTRLGPYEVTAQIGEGGMGEVYRATDTKLGREVALKVLPEAFAQDADRLARFRREAQVLASLNHPNIAQIHGLEDSGETHALVMELVEGPTLADRTAQGPLPLPDALAMVRQIADALEAAHEQGIIHRDLKPANVKVRDDGTVKVLDFGLAKALDAPGATAGSSASASMSPTITTPAMTEMGMILGTAAYMAPEQARGRPVDRRADIWAFGCVLYEMLTGRRAFEGEDVSMTLSMILQREPDFDALPASVSERVRQVLRLCLRKDPKQRIADIRDVRLALEGAFETAAPRTGEAPPGTPPARQRPLPLAIVQALATAAVVSFVAWSLWPTAEVRRVSRLAIAQPVSQPLSLGNNTPVLALSPDGTRAVYRVLVDEQPALVVRPLDALETTVLYEGNAFNPFFSPDGAWVGFNDQGDGTIKRVAVTGGPALTIGAVGGSIRGATWGEDDRIIFGTNTFDGLWQVSAGGGTPELLTTLDQSPGEGSHLWPELLPEGEAILFTAGVNGGTADDYRIVVRHLETGDERVLVSGGSHPHYVSSGHLVYAFAGTLRAVPFDLDRLAVTGNPVAVLGGLSTLPAGGANAALAGDGSLAYVVDPGTSNTERTLVWTSRDGREIESVDTIPPASYDMPRLSPDGERVLVWAEGDAWIFDLASGRARAVTRDGLGGVYGAWHPDGSQVAYSSARTGGVDAWVQPADGSGEARRLTDLEGMVHVDAWSPDGRVVAAHHHIGTTQNIIMIPTDEADRESFEFLEREFRENGAVFSPDGRYVAYLSEQTGRWEVYVRPMSGPGGETPVSVGGGREVVWSANGELFYRNLTGDRMMSVSVATDPTLTLGAPRELFLDSFYFDPGGSPTPQYAVTADGQRFLMIRNSEEAAEVAAPQIIVVQNWVEELKRLVPTD